MTSSNKFFHYNQIQKLIVIFLVASLGFANQTAESAVELVYFRGNVSTDQLAVVINWKTSYEQRTAGYFIKRKVKGSQDEPQVIPVLLNNSPTQFVQAAENGITGAEYSVIDQNIESGTTYEYSLWEQEFNNNTPTEPEEFFEIIASQDEESSSVSNPTPTLIPPTNTPDSSQPTSTPTESAFVTSTPVPDPNSTATPVETVDPSATEGSDEGSNQTETVTPNTTTDPTLEPTPTPIATTEPVQPTKSPPDREEPEPTLPGITPRPETEDDTSGGVAEASELPQEGAYPEPEGEGQENDQDYVPPEPTATLPIINEDAVQQIGSDANNNNAGGITESSTTINAQAVQQVSQEELSRSRLILWGGFISSMLLFISVMIATLYMYRQRNKGG